MPKGYVTQKTIDKALHREALRAIVVEHLKPMTLAQVAHAQGISHFMLRDPNTGKFERLTDPDQIQAALNAEGAEEGSSFYIWTKDPSTQAYTDLMNRALDKPTEHVDMVIAGEEELIARLDRGRKRNASRKS